MSYIEDGYLPDNNERVKIEYPEPVARHEIISQVLELDGLRYQQVGYQIVHIETGIVMMKVLERPILILPFDAEENEE